MKKFKKILSVLLAASLLLMMASCKPSEENNETSTGRYVETDISPDIDGSFMSFLTSDDVLICFDSGLKTKYESSDGGTSWNSTPGPGKDNDNYADITSITLLPDGNFLAYTQEKGLIKINSDGSSNPYPLEDLDNEENTVMMSLLQAVGDNRLILSYTSGGGVFTTRQTPGQGGNSENSGGETTRGFTRSGNSSESGTDTPMQGNAPVQVQGDTPMQGNAQGGSEEVSGDGQGDETEDGEESSGDEGQGGRRENVTMSSASSMTSKTLIIDLQSGQKVTELNESVTAAASDDNSIYLMDSAGTVKSYNMNDGTPTGKDNIVFGSGESTTGRISGMSLLGGASGGSVLASNGNNGLYAVYNKNLLLAEEGMGIQTILESSSYSIGTPRGSVNSVFALKDGSVVISVLEGGQNSGLYKYAWDDNAKINPDKTITVWSLKDNSFVRAAITDLRKKNPDSLINYEIGTGGDNAISSADAIKSLNTRLLNGSGPDVLILDGCPVESYAEKGMLEDLSGLIDTSGIYENLLAPYINDDKLYYLPAQFFMPALVGSTEALAKVQSLEQLVTLAVNGNDPAVSESRSGPFNDIAEEDRPELHFDNVEELFNIMWLSGAPAIAADNKLDTEKLREFLTYISALNEKYNLSEESGSRARLAMIFSDGGTASALTSSLVNYTSQRANYGAFTMGNLQITQMMMERANSEIEIFPGMTEGAWQPSTMASISADAENMDFAVELLKTMLSVDIQQLNYGEGLSVTREGMAAQIEIINERLEENGSDLFELDTNAFISKLKSPSMADTELTEMVWTTVESFCKNNLDIEGAVKEIEQNVKNYLAERQ